jgi:hypothetical protein
MVALTQGQDRLSLEEITALEAANTPKVFCSKELDRIMKVLCKQEDGNQKAKKSCENR